MSQGKNPRDILISPVVSEKSYGLLDEGKYTFIVDPRSNKTEIKIAVEQVFGVKVDSVHTMNRKGKARRTRFGIGKRKDTKRAIVTLRRGLDRHLRQRRRLRKLRTTPWVSASTSRRRLGVAGRAWPTSSRSPAPPPRSPSSVR